MADSGVNKGRRRFLVGATSVVGAVGAVGTLVPFVASWQPSAKAVAAGAPVRADFTKLEPGQRMTVEWRGKPVWIVNRTPEMIARTEQLDTSRLSDPESNEPQQPGYIKGALRASQPEVGVIVGICTHLGCSPLFKPEPEAAVAENWPGGFFCPCHGSYFDLAGRVFKGVPAPTNLEIPPHRFDGNDVIIGEDQEAV